MGDLFNDAHDMLVCRLLEHMKFLYHLFRHNKCMAGMDGMDVQKGNHQLILINPVRRNLSLDYLGKYCLCYNSSIIPVAAMLRRQEKGISTTPLAKYGYVCFVLVKSRLCDSQNGAKESGGVL
jgi:hypothetical protein